MPVERIGLLPAAVTCACGGLMLVFGGMVMEAFGCWSGCDIAEIMSLSFLLLPGLLFAGMGVLSLRWSFRSVMPAKWVSILYAALGIIAAGGTVFALSFAESDPFEYIAPALGAALAAMEFRIAWQILRQSQ
ncbi:MAG: hypothetical protein AAGA08_13515 [Pseudomonadota bacterium]